MSVYIGGRKLRCACKNWPVDATDREIDRLVYDLYGLAEKEIRIVEEATR